MLLFATRDLDLFERFHAFSRSHETWELDELAVTLCIAGVALILFGFRRVQDQRADFGEIQPFLESLRHWVSASRSTISARAIRVFRG